MIPSAETIRAAFAPRYDVDRTLGHGAMAVVFLARDGATGAEVAVKVVRPELAAVLGPERFHRRSRSSSGSGIRASCVCSIREMPAGSSFW